MEVFSVRVEDYYPNDYQKDNYPNDAFLQRVCDTLNVSNLPTAKRKKPGTLNEMSLLPLDLYKQMGSNKAHKEKLLINRTLVPQNVSGSLGDCGMCKNSFPYCFSEA